MLVASFQEVQAQGDDGILGTLVQAEETHTILLRAVPEQFIDLEKYWISVGQPMG